MTMMRADSLAQRALESEESRAVTDDLPVDDIVLQHYDREHLPLRRYLKLTGVDESTAQEIVQETFLRLYRHLRGNGDRTNLRAWCYRVAQNLARNELTSARQKRWSPLDEDTLKEVMPSAAVSLESQLLVREREQRLRDAITNVLSVAERESLVLRAQGLRYREIAEVLDVAISTAAENVQRALDKLKESL
jgi:RNA polymerase sigma-70 factor, ECF subfamily